MWKTYTVLLGYLAIETYRDIRKREISVRNTVFIIIVAIALRAGMILNGGKLVDELLFGVMAWIPGGLLLLIGIVTRQAIGYGDGILLLACGFCLGGKTTGLLLMTGLFLLFPVSLGLLIFGKARRETQMPFAPFVLAAYLVWLMQEAG